MLYIDNNVIKLTRGDTARIAVPITNDLTGTSYDMSPSDKLTITIKKRETDAQAVMTKTVIGTNSFHIVPSDTSNLAFGSYVYDVQLETESGDIYTVIVPTMFELLREVTW